MEMKQEYNKLYEHELRAKIKEKDITYVDELVAYLYGSECNDYQYKVIKLWAEDPEQTIWNRLNELWVIPLFLIAAPFRYVMFGDYKVNSESKLGKVLVYLLGVLR